MHTAYDGLPQTKAGLLAQATETFHAMVCIGFGGHHLVRKFEPGRLCLRCLACGYETPGWTIGASEDHGAQPTPTFRILVSQDVR